MFFVSLSPFDLRLSFLAWFFEDFSSPGPVSLPYRRLSRPGQTKSQRETLVWTILINDGSRLTVPNHVHSINPSRTDGSLGGGFSGLADARRMRRESLQHVKGKVKDISAWTIVGWLTRNFIIWVWGSLGFILQRCLKRRNCRVGWKHCSFVLRWKS